ncbi:MAG: methyltransferase domain-containing protein [Desulfuromonadaceae bacterium]|nr:methyltransferase domain-containing protein [Desulfuromonas sp.]MDY0185605.1 methyltransferase domain-containing protein [Desulfuromonadaceae bacterium]
MKDTNVDTINDFYNWSREYWVDFSSDPHLGFGGTLNFGCWDPDIHNLYAAQRRLFEIFTQMLVPLSSGERGLEIGCGMGGNSTRLCQEYPVSMVAMDISPYQLEYARNRAQSCGCGERIQHVHGSALAMPFSSDSFDFSICIESTFHYHDLPSFVAEQARILKPGAKGIIADITCEDNSKVRFRRGNFFYSVATMERLLQQNGLELLELKRIGPRVFSPIYQFSQAYNADKRSKLAKYWSLVFSNYASVADAGLMGYDIFCIRKVAT